MGETKGVVNVKDLKNSFYVQIVQNFEKSCKSMTKLRWKEFWQISHFFSVPTC